MSFSVVVTGASGFIGRALVKSLENEADIEVIPVCRAGGDASYICVGDYRNTPKGDVLVHLAEDPDRAHVNAAGDIYRKESGSVLDVLLMKGFDKVIYCSSAAVYGNRGNCPYTEESTVEPVDNYVRAKFENESRVLDSGGIVVRFSNVIGPNIAPNNVISDILKQISDSGSIKVRNDRPVCDFVWSSDVVEGLKILVSQGISGIYNIGTGKGTSIRELALMVLSISGQLSRKVETATLTPSFNVLDVSKMKRMYGWSAKKNVYQCIKILINNKKSKHN